MDTPIIKSEKIFLKKNPKFHIAIEAYKSLKKGDEVWQAIGVLFLALTQARHDILKMQDDILTMRNDILKLQSEIASHAPEKLD